MALNPSRTLYPNSCLTQYHIYPDGAAPGNIKEKYGYRAKTWGGGSGMANAIALCQPGDEILVWTGSYTLTAAINVNRPGITIRSQSGNKHSVVFNASATDDIQCVTIAAAGDNVTIADMTFIGDDSATPSVGLSSAGTGTVVRDCVFRGGDVGDTVAAISCAAASAVIQGCETFDYIYGLQLAACPRSLVEGNYLHSDNVDFRGIDVNGAALWSLVRENIIHGGATTGTEGIVFANGALLNTCGRNRIWSDADDPITPGSGGTEFYENTLMGETTAAWIVS